MDKSTRVNWRRIAILICLGGILFFALAGCGHNPPAQLRTKSETELAVSAIKMEWLAPCAGVNTPLTENTIGALLQDYVDVTAKFAICMQRHNDFVQYMAPIVANERSK